MRRLYYRLEVIRLKRGLVRKGLLEPKTYKPTPLGLQVIDSKVSLVDFR